MTLSILLFDLFLGFIGGFIGGFFIGYLACANEDLECQQVRWDKENAEQEEILNRINSELKRFNSKPARTHLHLVH